MRRTSIRARAIVSLLVGTLLLGACANGGAGRPNTSAEASVGPGLSVTIVHTSAGDALAGPDGMTLYIRTKDLAGTSTCTTGKCATSWPAFKSDGSQVRPGAGVSGAFGTTTWADGTTQLTYNGHPLYYYDKDVVAGDALGNCSGAWSIAATTVAACKNQLGPSGKPFPAPAIRAAENSAGEY